MCVCVCVCVQLAMEDEPVKQHQKQTTSNKHIVKCDVCGRLFRRESDKTGHTSKSEREKPVREQSSVQCQRCKRWFHRKRVALWCTDVRIRMIDIVTLCSLVRDRVTAASEKEGRKMCVYGVCVCGV